MPKTLEKIVNTIEVTGRLGKRRAQVLVGYEASGEHRALSPTIRQQRESRTIPRKDLPLNALEHNEHHAGLSPGSASLRRLHHIWEVGTAVVYKR